MCAAPFIRESDIGASVGLDPEEYRAACVQWIAERYREVWERAEAMQARLDRRVPIVVMGRLFAQGATFAENDGMSAARVGSLSQIPVSRLPVGADYVALGHLHRAQRVGGLARVEAESDRVREEVDAIEKRLAASTGAVRAVEGLEEAKAEAVLARAGREACEQSVERCEAAEKRALKARREEEKVLVERDREVAGLEAARSRIDALSAAIGRREGPDRVRAREAEERLSDLGLDLLGDAEDIDEALDGAAAARRRLDELGDGSGGETRRRPLLSLLFASVLKIKRKALKRPLKVRIAFL